LENDEDDDDDEDEENELSEVDEDKKKKKHNHGGKLRRYGWEKKAVKRLEKRVDKAINKNKGLKQKGQYKKLINNERKELLKKMKQ